MKAREVHGGVMIGGKAEGQALVSLKAFTYANGVDPSTGTVTDVRSDIKGLSLKGRVLVYSYGKGSTSGAAWFLETARRGNDPLAVLTQAPEPTAVVGSILAKVLHGKTIPVMSGFEADVTTVVKTGSIVRVDSAKRSMQIRETEK